jgi:hypothetical protein
MIFDKLRKFQHLSLLNEVFPRVCDGIALNAHQRLTSLLGQHNTAFTEFGKAHVVVMNWLPRCCDSVGELKSTRTLSIQAAGEQADDGYI